MVDINIRFCQLLLKSAMETLTKEERADFRRNSGTLRLHIGRSSTYLVEWPKKDSETGGTYAWEDQADNAYDAKAKAINHWVEHHASKFRDPHAVLPGQIWKTNVRHVQIVSVEGLCARVYGVELIRKSWVKLASERCSTISLSRFRKFTKVQ